MKSIKHYFLLPLRWLSRATLRSEIISKYLSRHFLKLYLALFYCNWMGRFPHLKHPTDLNEWLMKTSLANKKSDKRMLIAQCVDKYAVREYVESKGYGDTLNELYGVFDNVDDIDIDVLPNSFVMKMNNASGRNFICKDKNSVKWSEVLEMFRGWMKDRDFGLMSGEWQYSLIKPQIVIEKYLENLGESSLIDYKFNCFDGEVYSCFVAYNRNSDDPHGSVSFDDYDLSWNRTDNIKDSWHQNRKYIPRPSCYEEMLKMASDMTKGFDYVRFDVYEIDGKILFGEMTFTPQGCVLEFYKDDFLKETLKTIHDKKKN